MAVRKIDVPVNLAGSRRNAIDAAVGWEVKMERPQPGARTLRTVTCRPPYGRRVAERPAALSSERTRLQNISKTGVETGGREGMGEKN